MRRHCPRKRNMERLGTDQPLGILNRHEAWHAVPGDVLEQTTSAPPGAQILIKAPCMVQGAIHHEWHPIVELGIANARVLWASHSAAAEFCKKMCPNRRTESCVQSHETGTTHIMPSSFGATPIPNPASLLHTVRNLMISRHEGLCCHTKLAL